LAQLAAVILDQVLRLSLVDFEDGSPSAIFVSNAAAVEVGKTRRRCFH
jgi:hypothetical protein